MNPIEKKTPRLTNAQLLLPYAAPYFAYVAIGSLPGNPLSMESVYLLRLLIVIPILIWAWRKYVSLTGPNNPVLSIVTGIFAGIIGTFIWIVLLSLFAGSDETPWTEKGFILCLAAAGLVVPVFEELLMRGYVFRLVLQWDIGRKTGVKNAFEKAYHEKSIQNVEPGAWTFKAVALSTVIFTLGHAVNAWPASVAYGLLMAFLWIIRKDLLTCIVAHGTTNICLAIYIWLTKQWFLW